MEGWTGVESRLGKGSTFWFEVPLQLDPHPLDFQTEAPPVPLAELRGLRVLIVDDSEVNRRVLQEQVAAWGMRNDSVESGILCFGALSIAIRGGDPYDFLLLDSQMPKMDGSSVAAAVRAIPVFYNLPIIMLTSVGHSNDLLREGSLAGGPMVDACLTKPVRQTQLLNALATARAQRLNRAQATVDHSGSELPESFQERFVDEIPGKFAGSLLRVLVADDNVVNQKVAVRMLAKLGVGADVAANGREALRMLKAHPYDGVFMDCQMPEMDGYEATGEIRRTEKPGDHLAIIAMTADALSGAREHCLEVGMDDYIAKPVKLEDLSRTIQRWLLSERVPQPVE